MGKKKHNLRSRAHKKQKLDSQEHDECDCKIGCCKRNMSPQCSSSSGCTCTCPYGYDVPPLTSPPPPPPRQQSQPEREEEHLN